MECVKLIIVVYRQEKQLYMFVKHHAPYRAIQELLLQGQGHNVVIIISSGGAWHMEYVYHT